MNLTSQLFASPAPYPCVKVEREDPRYAAAMLSNMGDCNSEMSTISLYFYNGLLTRDCFEDFSECFQKMGMVEMHHLQIFGELALKLGTDPRLWSMDGDKMTYWSPAFISYPENILPLIKNCLEDEKDAIKKYTEQCSWIRDRYVVANLRRIIEDEKVHVSILEAMLKDLESDCRL